MAKLEVQLDDTFSRQLEKISNFDNIAPQILKKVAPILIAELENQIVKGGHVVTGSLVTSFRPKIGKSKVGNWYVAARPVGRDINGMSNMQKLLWIEFGTSQQVARPIVASTVKNAREKVVKILEAEYEKIINQ